MFKETWKLVSEFLNELLSAGFKFVGAAHSSSQPLVTLQIARENLTEGIKD